MKINLLVLSCILYFSGVYSQTFEQTVSGYYYNQDFPGRNVLITQVGDYLMVGKSLAINGLSSILLSRFHKDGPRLWTNNFETGEYANYRLSINAAQGNGYFVIASGPYLSRIIQTDQNGTRLWTKNISYGKYEDNGPLLLGTDSAGFLLCGTRELGAEENYQRVISMSLVDTSGIIRDGKIIRGTRHLTLQSIIKTSEEGWFISGRCGYVYPEGSDLFLAKTGMEGDTIWIKEYPEIRNIKNSSACQLKNNQFMITGTYISETSFQDRIFILWLDKNGNKILLKQFEDDRYQAFSVIQTFDNGFALTGSTEAIGNGQKDLMILKTDILGQTQWMVTYGGEYDDCGFEIHQTTDSGYIVAGATESYGQDNTCLIRTNAAGDVACRLDHSRFFSPVIYSVSADSQTGTVVINYKPVTGSSTILLYKESAVPGSFLLVNKKENNEPGIIYDSTALSGKRSYKYLMRIINECGDTSLTSTLHGTMFLEAFAGGNNSRNLIWNQYTGAEVQTYVILRGTLQNSLTELDFVPGMVTSYSDLNPPSGIVYYQIKALLLGEGSDQAHTQPISYSNIASLFVFDNSGVPFREPIILYPNPAFSDMTVDFPNQGNDKFTVSLLDLSGRIVRLIDGIYTNRFVFKRNNLPSGFYIFQLKGPGVLYRTNVIME